MCQERYRDGGSDLSAWAEPEVLVVCPRCGSRGSVHRADPPTGGQARRLTCAHCGLTRHSAGTTSRWGVPVDPWFGAALWLTADFRGHVVWAFNAAHLGELRAYVAASLREHSPTAGAPVSMLERLPAWMTSAGNRDRVVAVLDGLADRAR